MTTKNIQERDMIKKEHGSMPDAWDFINDTATHTYRWNGIMLSSDSPATFTTFTIVDNGEEVDFSTAAAYLPRDVPIPMFIVEIKLASGVAFLAK